MFKYTKYQLKKLETLLSELDFTVRYEKGNFQSGYALVEEKNIAVINKFFGTEGRINALLDVLTRIEVDEQKFSESSAKLYKQLMKLDTSEEE